MKDEFVVDREDRGVMEYDRMFYCIHGYSMSILHLVCSYFFKS